MAKITFEFDYDNRFDLFQILDKIVDTIPANCKITINWRTDNLD